MRQTLLIFILLFSVSSLAQEGLLQSLQPSQPWTYRNDQTGSLSALQRQSNEKSLRAIYQNELIAQVAPLLPKKFQLVYPVTAELQTMIDAVHFAMMQKPTGKEICKKATGGTPEQLDEVFGLQGPLATSLRKTCAEPSFTPKRNYSTSRSFGILFYDGEPPPFESWTSRFNATIIAIGPKDRNEKYLVRSLAHELAVKMDAKNNLSAKENLGYIYKGLDTCEIMSALRSPMVRVTFSTIRALQIEKALLQELGFPVENKPFASCEERFISVLPSVLDLSKAFFLENIFLDDTLKSQCPQTQGKIDSLDKILDLLNYTKIQVSDKEQSLCEFMSEVDLSNSSMTLYSNGPRPRLGDGTSKNSIQIRDLDNQMKLQNENFLKDLESLKKSDLRFEENFKIQKLELGPALPKAIKVNQPRF